MKPLEMILANAARSLRTIVLSEGADPRVVKAAVEACERGIARVILVGSEQAICTQLDWLGKERPEPLEIHDPATSPLTDELALLYHATRKHKGLSLEEALRGARQPHIYAALMVKAGLADGTLGGACLPTADIVRTAIQIIGPKPGTKVVSSFFLMLFCASHHQKKGAHVFADAGLVVEPDADELAQIAIASARSFTDLTGETPRVAMLSFSTRGSADHSAVTKVETATRLVRAADPDLCVDGALQFDAAFVPEVSAMKASDSPLGGNANVFIFPNLEAGNIGYKIAQRIGGAVAIGPILQGLAKPANDLSRGCSAEDVLHMIAVTAAQAERISNKPARHSPATARSPEVPPGMTLPPG